MTKRLWSYIWIPLLLLWELVLQPIWNLNVETIATSNGLNDELGDAARQVDPDSLTQLLRDAAAFLTGDFLWGAVTVGTIYLMFDIFAWNRRRTLAKNEPNSRVGQLSSVYTDAYRLERELRREDAIVERGRMAPKTNLISIGVSSKVRSFFAQLSAFNVKTPAISKDMTVSEALIVLDFLAIAMPFISKSQVDHLREEAKAFVSRLPQLSNRN